ncbi:MAG: DUF465 domain-containing protein [Kordiimonadaceae bacterium]|nr:DUF465 domain-containing protein [Kordiimonadaceae bacterium]
MSLETHVEALNLKHAHVDQNIVDEETRPFPDAMRLMQLKRKKLRLKEELGKIDLQH